MINIFVNKTYILIGQIVVEANISVFILYLLTISVRFLLVENYTLYVELYRNKIRKKRVLFFIILEALSHWNRK